MLDSCIARIFLLVSIVGSALGLSYCGGGGQPFNMDVNATIFIGDPSPASPFQFIVNPEQQNPEGTMTAQIGTEFIDRTTLDILSLDLSAEFSIGTVRITLDPANPSTATVFKLDGANRPFGTHTMNLNLIIETPDQNLVLSDVTLDCDTALLALAEDVPTLVFFLQGDIPKEIDLSALTVLVPASLITSDQDPQ